jgi:hypothetical protein
MAAPKHRRSVSHRPVAYLLLAKLAVRDGKSMSAWLEQVIIAAADAGGITVTEEEIAALKASTRRRETETEQERWERARALQDGAFA